MDARQGVATVQGVPDTPPALELRGLTKHYDDGTVALEHFDLQVPDGAFFGLLGPNGAGKTTLISSVCNLIRTTSGEVLVFGEPADSLTARGWVGLAEQDINLDRFLTVEETLVYHGGYFGMEKTDALARAREMIDVFDLRPKSDVRTPKLSGGMRRRLLLARALMHRPRLVILDEPTAGVDFELRQELWRYIRKLHEEGTTILLTTHYPEEAEELCEEIALIRGGRLIARDTADGLRSAYEAQTLADVYAEGDERGAGMRTARTMGRMPQIVILRVKNPGREATQLLEPASRRSSGRRTAADRGLRADLGGRDGLSRRRTGRDRRARRQRDRLARASRAAFLSVLHTDAPLGWRPMTKNRSLIILAVIAGVVFVVIAVIYFAEPAKSLPSFFPAISRAPTHHHTKHGIAAVVVAIGAFVLAWFQTGPGARDRRPG